MTEVLMPKATAVWLIENTGLTFEQIGDYCGLYTLEVTRMAKAEVHEIVRAVDPVANGQLTHEEIKRAEADPAYRLVGKKSAHEDMVARGRSRKGPRYTPLSRRQERPNAIAWLVKNHPEMSDGQISKLIGTTKTTIDAVRSRTHHNASNIQPQDPVALGLCSQTELDAVVRKAAAKRQAMLEASGQAPEGPSLSQAYDEAADVVDTAAQEAEPDDRRTGPGPSADAVFAKLGGASKKSATED